MDGRGGGQGQDSVLTPFGKRALPVAEMRKVDFGRVGKKNLFFLNILIGESFFPFFFLFCFTIH